MLSYCLLHRALQPTGQFGKFAACVDLIRQYEREKSAEATHFDWVFKTRPDLFWMRPVNLVAIAARLQPHTILGANDVNLFVHRSQWSVLTRLRPGRLLCEPRCDGRSAPVLRRYFSKTNEYCLMISAFATAGAVHIEISHPSEREIMLLHSIDVHGANSFASSIIGLHSYRSVRHDDVTMCPRKNHNSTAQRIGQTITMTAKCSPSTSP